VPSTSPSMMPTDTDTVGSPPAATVESTPTERP
jgi:hypothetical protein